MGTSVPGAPASGKRRQPVASSTTVSIRSSTVIAVTDGFLFRGRPSTASVHIWSTPAGGVGGSVGSVTPHPLKALSRNDWGRRTVTERTATITDSSGPSTSVRMMRGIGKETGQPARAVQKGEKFAHLSHYSLSHSERDYF